MRDLGRWSGHNRVPMLERGNEPISGEFAKLNHFIADYAGRNISGSKSISES